MPSTLIYLQGVTKKFGKKVVLNNINLNISQGEIFGLIGANGSGKTTLLRTIVGFFKPEQGNLLFNSLHIRNVPNIEKQFGFATQDSCFYPKLTVKENIEHFANLYGLNKSYIKSEIEKLLRWTNLYDTKNIISENLSGGMKKRLDIACALIHNPRVLILDEPTADLDPFLRREILGLIKQINNRGTTVIIASHFLGEIEHLCDRIAILHNGNIIGIGTANELKDMYSKNEEIHLETSPGRYKEIAYYLKNRNLPISSVSFLNKKMIIYTPEAELVLHHTLHILEEMQEQFLDVDVNKPSLNEVFESLIKGRKYE